MNLIIKDILNVIDGKLLFGDENTILKDFFINTKEMEKDGVFVGIKGENSDGYKYYLDCI